MAEIKILKNLKRGPYVQFGTTDKLWDDDAIFLDEAIFGVFSDRFSKSNQHFNYYGPTEFKESELRRLHTELTNFDVELGKIIDFESFQAGISNLPMARNFFQSLQSENHTEVKSQWASVVTALKEINLTLLELVENCASENKVLWVFGV